jgi:hypothetical protein
LPEDTTSCQEKKNDLPVEQIAGIKNDLPVNQLPE